MSDYITAEETIRQVRMMPVQERARLKDILYLDNEDKSGLKERLTEQRFAEGRVCPHCGGHHVRKNGHRKDDTMLGAIVEADEAFFPTSYKGNSRHLRAWLFLLLFRLLPKKGNFNTEERIAIIERHIALFGKDSIDCLVADREFIGVDWLTYIRLSLDISVRIPQKHESQTYQDS